MINNIMVVTITGPPIITYSRVSNGLTEVKENIITARHAQLKAMASANIA